MLWLGSKLILFFLKRSMLLPYIVDLLGITEHNTSASAPHLYLLCSVYYSSLWIWSIKLSRQLVLSDLKKGVKRWLPRLKVSLAVLLTCFECQACRYCLYLEICLGLYCIIFNRNPFFNSLVFLKLSSQTKRHWAMVNRIWSSIWITQRLRLMKRTVHIHLQAAASPFKHC